MSGVVTTSMLLEHFDRISEAPGAVARLRRFVLELAVRGRLVAADASDAPVGRLIKDIETLRAEEGVPMLRGGNPSGVEGHTIPARWARTPLGYVARVVMGQSPPGDTYNTVSQGVPLINGPVEFTAGPFGTTVVNQFTTAPTKMCRKGDFLLCVRGSTTGRTNVAGFEACLGRGVAAIQPFFAPDQFLRLVIVSMRERIIDMGRGIAFPSVSRSQLEDLPIPLPPLAEQHRIVAKVDELMALFDELEAAQTKREKRRDRLVTASLHALTNGEGDDEAANAQAREQSVRFYLKHLPRLTTRPEHIQQLRQAILDLAVCGCLVAQVASEEPPALTRSSSNAGLEQSPVKSRSGDSSALPCALPPGWATATLLEIATSISDGDHLPPPKSESGVPFLVIGDVRSGRPDFTNCRHVEESYYASLDSIRKPQQGDVLYTLVGSFGIPVVVSEARRFCIQRHIAIIRPGPLVDVTFLAHALASRLVFTQAEACATGIAQKTVPLSGLRRFVVPVPPLAEQRRIVATIDRLMAACDALEKGGGGAQSALDRFFECTLHGSLTAASQLPPGNAN